MVDQRMSKSSTEFISVTGLKQRGWTDKLIKILLGEPDKTAQNPHYRSAAPMRLYLKSRVEEVETSAEWTALKGEADKRKQSASKAVETKLQKLRVELAKLKISIIELSKDELIQKACDHYNSRQTYRGIEFEPAGPESNPRFIDRITVNYLRHVLTPYERELAEVKGKTGVGEAYMEISRKVFDAISDLYPWLKDECARQLRERRSGE